MRARPSTTMLRATLGALVLGLPAVGAAQRSGPESRPRPRGATADTAIHRVTAQNASSVGVTPEVSQSATLPALPRGMTQAMIVEGDSIFHGDGHCYVCHGVEAQGEPDAGSALTNGVNFIPDTWEAIDSLVAAGIPDGITRSSIRMPPRGGASDLTPEQMRRVAAYVWAITTTRGEPWPGGHTSHASMIPRGVTLGRAVAPPARPKKP